MDYQEFEDRFDVLYNNITSNQAPGLNSYEKSVFLTKAQDEILKNYFNPKSNKLQEGYDDNQKRQIDFSNITKTITCQEYASNIDKFTVNNVNISVYTNESTPSISGINFVNNNSADTSTASIVRDDNTLKIVVNIGSGGLDKKDLNTLITHAIRKWNSYEGNAPLPVSSGIKADFEGTIENGSSPDPVNHPFNYTSSSIDGIISKIDSRSQVFSFPEDAMFIINERITSSANGLLRVIPIDFEEYDRLMSKPYKYPTKYTAWRLINSVGTRYVEIIAPGTLSTYRVRYVRKPKPIILANLEGLTINGYTFDEAKGCELDDNLHEEILQRAVELAKVAWTSVGNDNAQAIIQSGQRSE